MQTHSLNYSLIDRMKIRLDILHESSAAKQMIHMKCQFLFSLKNIKSSVRMLSTINLLSTLRHSLRDLKHIILHDYILELILKGPITTAADNILIFFDISC